MTVAVGVTDRYAAPAGSEAGLSGRSASVLTGSAVLRLYRSGMEAVLAMYTQDKAVRTVSVAPMIAKAIRS